ncbi:hypothetical protein DQ354_17720 [Arthrobacter sp. AQ5-06]|nr:hypothetical protein DQ354_17720 [Arthrobacter sp. AQ5-06]
MTYVNSLGDVGRGDIAVAGGKAVRSPSRSSPVRNCLASRSSSGIPAVLGTGVATQRLRSGQQIRVDGDAGTVTIEHPAPA